MKYIVEWQAGGELTIDTEGTDWTPEELIAQVDQAVSDAVDKISDAVVDEFDDCDVEADEAVYECKPRRIT